MPPIFKGKVPFHVYLKDVESRLPFHIRTFVSMQTALLNAYLLATHVHVQNHGTKACKPWDKCMQAMGTNVSNMMDCISKLIVNIET